MICLILNLTLPGKCHGQKVCLKFEASCYHWCLKLITSIQIFKVDTYFQNSLLNDPFLSVQVSLADVLILNDPSLTPWTNSSIVDYPGKPSYKYQRTVLANASVLEFANSMMEMNLPYSYDFAFALIK